MVYVGRIGRTPPPPPQLRDLKIEKILDLYVGKYGKLLCATLFWFVEQFPMIGRIKQFATQIYNRYEANNIHMQ